MRLLLRLALPLGLVALLAFPAAAGAQANLKISGMTHLFNAPQTGDKAGTVNSDLAFWGNRAYAGDYDGFRIFDITNPAAPTLLSDVRCNAGGGPEPVVAQSGQGDVSVWQNRLLFRSVDTAQTKPECDRVRVANTATPGFEGIDIFDVSNPANPQWIAGVATDCGSHTHTLIPDLGNNRLLLYVSSYPAAYLSSTPTEWGNTCERMTEGGQQGHDKISIVEVPLDAPQNARVIAEPQLNLEGDFLAIEGFKGCHDISVFLELNLAAGACLTQGVMMDISNPVQPRITNRLVNPNIDTCARTAPTPPENPLCLWHSATSTWDGRYVVFGDEAGGGGGPECDPTDPPTRGAFWLHSLANPTFPIASFKIERPQPDRGQAAPPPDPLPNENCTAHIMNFVPINGRYVMPSSWYFGGTSVVNWTDINAPFEMAFFEIDPTLNPDDLPFTDTWTSYWYNDFIYTNDIERGVDVLRLDVPWRARAFNLTRFNPQTQEGRIRCNVAVHGRRLRAARRGMLHVQVRARGRAVARGQAVVGTRVVLRGAGVRAARRTNARGEAQFRVRPTRRGRLQVRVPAVQNMLGCRTTRRVAAAPRRARPPVPTLTGRRS